MTFAIFVILLAFIFDFTNGFHDAANSIATIVSTNVLKPWQAVIWAALFNFVAFFFFNLTIASTIGTGLIHPHIVTPYLIFAAIVGAIAWNLVTWYFGLPSSSTHALIGGLAGAALAKVGFTALEWTGFTKVLLAIVLSPFLGLAFGWLLAFMAHRFIADHSKSNHHLFKWLQLCSSALLSLTHGGNDAQKTMGIVAILLYSGGWLGAHFYVPTWVIISSYLVIALGTLAGGWRIVHTMGHKITTLNPLKGSCAETAAALVIYSATLIGIPISTTQTVTGAIAGVGLSKNLTDTHWKILHKIFLSWCLTLPATALIAAIIMMLRR